MYTIKMNNDKSLITTIRATIYQYEKNADTLIFLLPMTYEEKNIADCVVLLRYILPNNIGKSEELEMCPEPYKNYYQFRLPISSSLTDVSGEIELWLNITDPHDEWMLRTGNLTIEVRSVKDITQYLPSDSRNQLDRLSAKVTRLEQEKADNILYNNDKQYIQLTANGIPIGEQIDMRINSGDDGAIEFDDSDDAVIYF